MPYEPGWPLKTAAQKGSTWLIYTRAQSALCEVGDERIAQPPKPTNT